MPRPRAGHPSGACGDWAKPKNKKVDWANANRPLTVIARSPCDEAIQGPRIARRRKGRSPERPVSHKRVEHSKYAGSTLKRRLLRNREWPTKSGKSYSLKLAGRS